jgi:hypothetical protein
MNGWHRISPVTTVLIRNIPYPVKQPPDRHYGLKQDGAKDIARQIARAVANLRGEAATLDIAAREINRMCIRLRARRRQKGDRLKGLGRFGPADAVRLRVPGLISRDRLSTALSPPNALETCSTHIKRIP